MLFFTVTQTSSLCSSNLEKSFTWSLWVVMTIVYFVVFFLSITMNIKQITAAHWWYYYIFLDSLQEYLSGLLLAFIYLLITQTH